MTVTTTTTKPTTAERIVQNEAKVSGLLEMRQRALARVGFSASAVDAAGLAEELAQIDAQVELEGVRRAWLWDMRVLEIREDHQTGIDEALVLQHAAGVALRDIRAELERAAAEVTGLERASFRLAVENDNAGTRTFRRRAAFAAWSSENAEALLRAEAIAKQMGE